MLVLAAPLMPVIAAAGQASSPGPVFFVQERLGRDGRPFRFYKFRSMVHNSDDAIHRQFAAMFINGDDDGCRKSNDGERGLQAEGRSPRDRASARWLRRTSLDELPQLFNILRGEMSLVGPRPPIAYEIENYQPWHMERLKVTPGLTGLWQVSGRSRCPSTRWCAWTSTTSTAGRCWLDLRILLKTVPVVLRGTGGLLSRAPSEAAVKSAFASVGCGVIAHGQRRTARRPVDDQVAAPTRRRPEHDKESTIMIKMGVIGCGYWGPNLIRNFHNQPDVELAAIADLGREAPGARRPALSGRHEDHRLPEIIEIRTIDAVVVATPVSTHFPLGMEVLEAGKHLFIEKPMATSADECRRADRPGRAQRAWSSWSATPSSSRRRCGRSRSLIDPGELGDIYYVNITRVNLGIFQKDVNVVWDLAPHDVAMLNYLFDADPVRVSATGRCYVQRDLGIEDVAFLTLEYPGGTLAHIHVSWLDPNKIRKCTFVGSRKMLVYDDVSPTEKIRVYDKGVDVQPHYDNFGEFQLLVPLRRHLHPAPRHGRAAARSRPQHFLDVHRGRGRAPEQRRPRPARSWRCWRRPAESIKEDGRPIGPGLRTD